MYTLESFCNFIWESSYLKVLDTINKTEYSEFIIPKKNGFRKINYLNNDSLLAELQKKLRLKFLEIQPLPMCVKGFRKGENYLSYLTPHIGSKFFLRIDIESFFPSINEDLIKKELKLYVNCISDDDQTKLLDLITEIVTLDGVLPQGASTSPTISNLVMARVDQRILKYCQIFDITYTRYADDLLFSSLTFDFRDKMWFLKKIKHILASQKLKLNYSKIKYGVDDISLNGYIITSDEIRLSRSRLSDIRLVCAFVNNNTDLYKSGRLDDFLAQANMLFLKHRDLHQYPFSSIFQIVQYLCGYRAFLISFIDDFNEKSNFQKNLKKLIRKIEKQIITLS